jgi:hypothetical protein
MYPLLLGAVAAAQVAFVGGPNAATEFWQSMAFMGGFDVIMLLVAYGAYEFIIGA